MKFRFFTCITVLTLFVSCNSKKDDQAVKGNPAAEGFDLANSDPAAIELADSVMQASGGRAHWDQVRFISWTSDGRKLAWDKQKEKARIEDTSGNAIYLLDTNTGDGKVQVNGNSITDSDLLKTTLKVGRSIWEKESLSLLMPFQLKSSGVTLMYLGEDTLRNGIKCNVLELSKKDGEVPDSKYRVYVDLKDNLIRQVSYFQHPAQDSASIVWRFDNYKKYGNILLSADRQDRKGPADVKVNDELSDRVFEEFIP